MPQVISVRKDGHYSINWGDVSVAGVLGVFFDTPSPVIPYLIKVKTDLNSQEQYEVHVEIGDHRSFTHLIDNDGNLQELDADAFIPNSVFEAIMSHKPVMEEGDEPAPDEPEAV